MLYTRYPSNGLHLYCFNVCSCRQVLTRFVQMHTGWIIVHTTFENLYSNAKKWIKNKISQKHFVQWRNVVQVSIIIGVFHWFCFEYSCMQSVESEYYHDVIQRNLSKILHPIKKPCSYLLDVFHWFCFEYRCMQSVEYHY